MRVLQMADDLADSLWCERDVHDEVNTVVNPGDSSVRLPRVDVVCATRLNGQLPVVHEPIVLQRRTVVQEHCKAQHISGHTGVIAMGHEITPCVASNKKGATQRLKRLKKGMEARAGMVDVSLFIELELTYWTTQLMHGLRSTWHTTMTSTRQVSECQTLAVVRAISAREIVNPVVLELRNLMHELPSVDVEVEWLAVTQIE